LTDVVTLEENLQPGSDPYFSFDFQDAFIPGGMIVGQAYEDAQGEKEQLKQLKKENKDEDCSDL
jgi:hypothetical protein